MREDPDFQIRLICSVKCSGRERRGETVKIRKIGTRDLNVDDD